MTSRFTSGSSIANASATVAGKVELATTAETQTGTDPNRAVTPDGLNDMTDVSGKAWVLDEDDMASDDATKLSTQQAIKKYVDDQVAAGGGGAIARVGGNTTEATTTSTSETELIAVAGLSIAAGVPIEYHINGRKTSGAAAAVSLGLRINATIVANTAGDGGWNSSTSNQAEDGMGWEYIPPTVTNYQAGNWGVQRRAVSSSGANITTSHLGTLNNAALNPIATVTDIDTLGISDNASNTLGADEHHIYTRSVS